MELTRFSSSSRQTGSPTSVGPCRQQFWTFIRACFVGVDAFGITELAGIVGASCSIIPLVLQVTKFLYSLKQCISSSGGLASLCWIEIWKYLENFEYCFSSLAVHWNHWGVWQPLMPELHLQRFQCNCMQPGHGLSSKEKCPRLS